MFPRPSIYQLVSNDSTTTATTNNDDDDNIDEENNNQQSDIEIVDLCHSSPSIVSLTTTNNTMNISTASNELPFLVPPSRSSSTTEIKHNEPITLFLPPPYTPHTLQQENNRRYSILPAFPTSIYHNQAPLLLANVPKNKLNDEQLARRQQGVYPITYTIKKEYFDIPSYFRDSYQSFMSSLICQFNIDESILDYNLQRFSKCFQIFASNYIQRHRYFADEFELNEKQKKYAFEFYLQIDVDLFFLKTCSFRNTQPRSTDKGLFCIDEPTAENHLIPCNNCPLCVPPYNPTRRQSQQQQAFIQFGSNQQFQFLNGYKTILNCHTYCHTKNIIYVMICPCGQYEYIGETSLQLIGRLWHHRQHFNRIIHEFLIGERNVQLTQPQHKDSETLTKDRMLLYRHACRCPNAMQIFLNFNPIYHCFIPVTMEKATEQSQNYVLPSSLVLHDSINPTSIGSRDRRFVSGAANIRSDESVRTCIRQIPSVPPGYTFSIRQRVEQFQYFKNNLDINTKQDKTMDLFNVAVIAVLPHDASHTVRRFVESLFITHTEAKLNTFGHLLQQQDESNTSNYVHPMSYEAKIIDRGNWCHNLVFRHF